MNILEIIDKKKNCLELSSKEIDFLVQGYTKGEIPDYQMSALLMAIRLNGMTMQETSDLTMSMVHSGEVLNLKKIPGIKVDKHSTGGIGDKTTLILGPLMASLGVNVAKMSGRGLGATGGTIDKLESIPGFSSDMTDDEFIYRVKHVGFVDASQTKDLAPADKLIYALRDVTGTVDSIPLIASSIMSKKIAGGADKIVLDVKCGSGAFMPNLCSATQLARTMIDIGKLTKREVVAVITDMNEPLGTTVGNALEVEEAIDFLKGKQDERLKKVVYELGFNLFRLSGMSQKYNAVTRRASFTLFNRTIENGIALDKMREFIESQGGNPDVVDDTSLLPHAEFIHEVKASHSGVLVSCNAEEVGMASMILGAGRRTKDDVIDMGAGIVLTKKLGDQVKKGDTFAILHTNRKEAVAEAEEKIKNAYLIDKRGEEVKIHNVIMKTLFD